VRKELEEELRGRLEAEKAIDAVRLEAEHAVAEARKATEEELRARLASEKKLERATAELRQASGEASKATRRAADLERTLAKAGERTEAERKASREDIQRIKAEKEALERRMAATVEWEKEARGAIEQARAAAEGARAEADAAIGRATAQERALGEAAASAEQTRDGALAQLKQREAHVMKLERRIVEIEDIARRSTEELKDTRAELGSVQAQLAASERTHSEHEEKLAGERAARERAEQELQRAVHDSTRAEREVAVIETRIAEALDRRLAATIDSEANARQQLETQRSRVEARAAELGELEKRVEAARSLLDEVQVAADQQNIERADIERRLQALDHAPPPDPATANGGASADQPDDPARKPIRRSRLRGR
jgi:chromosome segregation ATPase